MALVVFHKGGCTEHFITSFTGLLTELIYLSQYEGRGVTPLGASGGGNPPMKIFGSGCLLYREIY